MDMRTDQSAHLALESHQAEAALARLRDLIEEGGVGPDRRLPPERVLAGRIGVGRSTLRRALAVLESEGRIWRHVGQGTFVGGPPGAADAFAQASPAAAFEARALIEPGLAALAALRASAEEIAMMRQCVAKSASAADLDMRDRWMATLFRTIARAAGNPVLERVVASLIDLRTDEAWQELRRRKLTKDWQRELARQHEAIVEAIAARDPDTAGAAMRAHWNTVRAGYFGVAGHIGLGVE